MRFDDVDVEGGRGFECGGFVESVLVVGEDRACLVVEDGFGFGGGGFIERGGALEIGALLVVNEGFELGGGGFIDRGGALLEDGALWSVDDGLGLREGGSDKRGVAVIGQVFRFGSLGPVLLWRSCGGDLIGGDFASFSEASFAFVFRDGFGFSNVM